jgi:hypothetical protein
VLDLCEVDADTMSAWSDSYSHMWSGTGWFTSTSQTSECPSEAHNSTSSTPSSLSSSNQRRRRLVLPPSVAAVYGMVDGAVGSACVGDGPLAAAGAGDGNGDGVGGACVVGAAGATCATATVQTRNSTRVASGDCVSGVHVQRKYGVGMEWEPIMPSGKDGHGLVRALQYVKGKEDALMAGWGKTNCDMVNTWWQGCEKSAKWSNGIYATCIDAHSVAELDAYLTQSVPKGEGPAQFSRGEAAPMFATLGYVKYGKVQKYVGKDQSAHTLVLSPWLVFSMCAHPIVNAVTELMHIALQEAIGKRAKWLVPCAGHWLDYHGSTHFTPHRDTEEDRVWDFIDVSPNGDPQFGTREVSWTTILLLSAAPTTTTKTSMCVVGYPPVEYACAGSVLVLPSGAVHKTVRGSQGDRKVAIFWGVQTVDTRSSEG